jgi:hypothetical protein
MTAIVAAALSSGLAHAATDPLSATPVLEYYNNDLDHYFLSTEAEAAIIDAGGAGPGWSRTGYFFRVEPMAYHPNGRYVCRFYGSVSPGPNSHFFTVDIGECDFLRKLQAETPATQPRWNFEGLVFPAGPATSGRCENAYYRTPVQRLYNDGVAKGVDPNHRYATDDSVVREMLGKGWILEGVAFCAR